MSVPNPAAADRRYTIEEYLTLPDDEGWRDELVRGRLVREPIPGGEHGWIQVILASALHGHADAHGLGVVLVESGYVLAESPPTVRGPDVSFVSRERIPPEGVVRGHWRMAPDLAVEVVSPSNRLAEMQEKVLEYLDAGSRMVWVVDPRTRSITVYRSPAEIRLLRRGDTLDGGNVVPGFRLPVEELFPG